MNKQEQWALDRMVARDGLPAILAALVQSYDFHLNNTNPKGYEDHIARLQREKNQVSAMLSGDALAALKAWAEYGANNGGDENYSFLPATRAAIAKLEGLT